MADSRIGDLQEVEMARRRESFFADIFRAERPGDGQRACYDSGRGPVQRVEELPCEALLAEIEDDFRAALQYELQRGSEAGTTVDEYGYVPAAPAGDVGEMLPPSGALMSSYTYQRAASLEAGVGEAPHLPGGHCMTASPRTPVHASPQRMAGYVNGERAEQSDPYLVRGRVPEEHPGPVYEIESPVTPPHSYIKRSPRQGVFPKTNGRDAPVVDTYPMAHNSGSGYTTRTGSFTTATLKNITSTFQHKRKAATGRTIPQKYSPSSSAYDIQQAAQTHAPSSGVSRASTTGPGIRTRHSSASLNGSIPNRYAQSTPTLTQNKNYTQHHRSSSTLYSKHVIASSSMKRPLVYPAMLSRVATRFKKTIQLGEHKKDGLLYRDAFTGQEAVDALCSIIRTTDRNLALLLGRALDAQKLFHDVVYEHRLRDSPNEVYEFTGNSRIIGGTGSMDAAAAAVSMYAMDAGSTDPTLLKSANSVLNNQHASVCTTSTLYSSTSTNSDPQFLNDQVDPDTLHGVNGVFTLLAECYSATCTRDKLCYSISCPRRLEQQARLNLKPNGGLQRNISLAINDDEEEKPSWASSVDESIWSNLSKTEIKRQEAIYEVYITEKNFVKSLEILRDTFMKKLAETNIIPSDIRKNFIKHVFAHVNDIYSVNRRFLNALSERQKASPIVEGIGDVFLKFIPFFEPFVLYVASRPYAKYLIETQRSVNPYFARFDEDLMNSKLRHGIDSFLSQGVSRPGRYVLLVREIMKSSDPETNKRDLESLTRAMDALKDFMKRIDKASGAAQDRHDVKLLKQKILFKNEYVNMGLNDEKRKIMHEGLLSRKELTKSDSTVAGDIQFYMLDNMLLFLKAKPVNKWNQHKVFQRPVPLPLLFVYPGEDMPPLKKYVGSRPDASGQVIFPENYSPDGNPKNAVTFLYYGAKHRFQITLYAAQYAAIQTLLDKINKVQTKLITSNDIFNVTKISDRFFDYSNKINSVASCDGGRKLLIATNQGLFMSNIRREKAPGSEKITTHFSMPVRIVQRSNITQISVMEEFQSVLMLVDKKLYSCHLDLLLQGDSGTQYFKKHAKEVVNHVNFFADGDCDGKRIIVTAHCSAHAIKWFEHEHPLLMDGSRRGMKRKINEVQFDSEPVSISFLRLNLCIGCKKGFQIVSISQNAHETFPDPADTSLEFAWKDTLKPIAIYRVSSMFFLCYSEFAFFVNNQGWRKRESHTIHWEGEPEKFAIWYPYILAFDSNFIEIRRIDTGELVRCILGDKIRMLHSSSQETIYVYEDERGYDTIASLDFWG
ncbi:AaceriAFR585Wp [[Ashbya] aceris (nom. inval.)]|nr:AaceriAFR585Wp [[Ashbya] aceris (nom. inval.)]